jgi:hypothetical protein
VLWGLFSRAISNSSLYKSHVIVDYVSLAYIKLIMENQGLRGSGAERVCYAGQLRSVLRGLFSRTIGHSSLYNSHMIMDYVSSAFIKFKIPRKIDIATRNI